MKKATTSYLDEPIPVTKLSDQEWAQAWYALAAESDSNHEQAQLCGLYNRSNGIDWFLSAAIGGDIYAMYTMGKMYSKGVGVSENPTKAATWFSKASAAGISYAHYELAKICNDGIGLDPDPEYAENLFKRALSSLENQEKLKPNIHAEYIISTIYEHGLGVDKNSNLTNYWRHMADESTEISSYADCTEGDSMESVLTDTVPDEPISRNPTDLQNSNLPPEPVSPVAEPEAHKVIKFEKPKGHGKKKATRQPVKKSQPDAPCLDYLDILGT
jgi:hypothetical protein